MQRIEGRQKFLIGLDMGDEMAMIPAIPDFSIEKQRLILEKEIAEKQLRDLELEMFALTIKIDILSSIQSALQSVINKH